MCINKALNTEKKLETGTIKYETGTACHIAKISQLWLFNGVLQDQ